MSKYYINISNELSEHVLSSSLKLISAKESIREGKLFDAMDKINELERLMSFIKLNTESLKGNASLDANNFKHARRIMENYLFDHVEEWVDLSWTDDIELFEMYVYHTQRRSYHDEGISYNQSFIEYIKQMAK